MKWCDHCKQNRAVVEMNVQINGQRQKKQLCEMCYEKVKNEMKFPAGLSPFDEFFNAMAGGFGQQPQTEGRPVSESGGRGKGGGLLDDLGKNLTDAAKAGLIDPVIGREKEVERVIETLNRRNKNNPVLIGEPGVGKTAIAEGLARKIAEGDVPNKLKNKDIYLLDVSSLVANTGIRGQFEEKMKQLLAELKERKNVIVFIDEVHQIVGAGSAEGSSDAGNIMKPALARGEIQMIGATTLKEYRKIEKDAALERRLQPVMVNEPTVAEAVRILQGLKKNYEEYHQVTYTDEALRACVTLADRYIHDRHLPDKAIDLMDEAGSKVNLRTTSGEGAATQERLEQIARQKEQATKREDYEEAARLRDEEKKLLDQLEKEPQQKALVDVETVAAIVEGKTGIPVRRLQKDEQNQLKNLAQRLRGQVIGQDEAVQKVAKAIRRNRAGLRRGQRPIGSFLFVGPTGVGKTELSRALARELFGDEDAMIRLDMSEYMEKHSVSKLIGSPPGYVGHEEAGQLTERVRRKPYSIVLLDEIEKAHPDVQHMFLQIMEDGRLTDSQGRTVSFKDTVMIMTSNAGAGRNKVTVGFTGGDEKTNILEALSDTFRPEFLNRFDGIIEFRSLEKEDLLKIVNLMLDEVKKACAEREIALEISQAAKEQLAELGYDPKFGARPLRRVIEEKVEDGIADLLIEKESVQRVRVEVENGEIVVKSA